MKSKWLVCAIILGICFVAILHILIKYGSENKRRQISLEFPAIPIDSTFTGVISTSYPYTNSIPKGALHIILLDGRKISVTNSLPEEIIADKNNIKNLFLANFAQPGDTIMKPAHKDSLYVFKKGKKYTFYLASKERIDFIMNQQNL